MKLNYFKILLTILTTLFVISSKAQIITEISPNICNAGSTISVGMSGQGTHFGQGTSTTQVWFSQGTSTIYSSIVHVIYDDTLVADVFVPNNIPTGVYNTNIYNSVDSVVSFVNSFTINANPNPPQIISVAPNYANAGNTISVTISGQNTNFAQGTSTVQFTQGTSTLSASSITVLSATQIIAQLYVPNYANLGSYNVEVSNSFDGNLMLANGFVVNQGLCNNIDILLAQPSCNMGVATFDILGGTPPFTININGFDTVVYGNYFDFYPQSLATYQINYAFDSFGCPANLIDSTITTEILTVTLVASSSIICQGSPVTFTASFGGGSNIANTYYNYGDGINGISTTHTYTAQGTFLPTIQVSNGNCSTSAASNPIIVSAQPQINITNNVDATCGLSNGILEFAAFGNAPFAYSVAGPASYTSTNAININLDGGNYSITINDANGCSSVNTITVNNQTQITNITGTVTGVNGVLATNANILLYQINNGVAAFVNTTNTLTDNAGNYSFANLSSGDYLIKAVPDSMVNPLAVSTYFGNTSLWAMADTLHVNCANTITANITLDSLPTLNGSSVIAGSISNFSSSFFQAFVAPQISISGVVVNLFNANTNTLVATVITDSLGNFIFTNLPAGSYIIYIDIPGMEQNAFTVISIGTGNFYNILPFFIDENAGVIYDNNLTVSISKVSLPNNNINVYPNPFKAETSVKYTLQESSNVLIVVYNLLGEKVATLVNANKNVGTYTEQFKPANKGVYFSHSTINGITNTHKIVCIE